MTSRPSRRNRGGKHWDPNHPSRKHDVPQPQAVYIEVAGPVPGQPRRRDRRAAARDKT